MKKCNKQIQKSFYSIKITISKVNLNKRFSFCPVSWDEIPLKQVSSNNGPLVLTVEPFTSFRVRNKFSFKIQQDHFYPLFKVCHQVHFQKNLMNLI